MFDEYITWNVKEYFIAATQAAVGQDPAAFAAIAAINLEPCNYVV
jgi:hypothetical protein